jgi:hypothetical protein
MSGSSPGWKWIFYPMHLWFNNSRKHYKLWWWSLCGIWLVVLGSGCVIGVARSFEESAGWTQHAGTVIHAGTTPNEDADDMTMSVVRFMQGGIWHTRTLGISWWQGKGTVIPVWTKGHLLTLTNPDGIGGIHWILLPALVASFVVAKITVRVLGAGKNWQWRWWPETAFDRHIRGRVESRYGRLSQTITLEDAINLCICNPDVRIDIRFATKITACPGDVKEFRSQHFPGRGSVSLFELIPLLDRENRHVGQISRVVLAKFKQLGIVHPDTSYISVRSRLY